MQCVALRLSLHVLALAEKKNPFLSCTQITPASSFACKALIYLKHQRVAIALNKEQLKEEQVIYKAEVIKVTATLTFRILIVYTVRGSSNM